MPLRTRLASLLLTVLMIGSVQDALADDPPLDRAVVDAQLKQRRENLKTLEEWVVDQREEVQRQMTDVVVGQQDLVAKARKEYEKAQETAKVARYQVQEYLKGTYLQDNATYKGKITLAMYDLEQAIDRRADLEEKSKKGTTVDPNRVIAADLDKQQAQFDLEQAQMQLEVLEKYTKNKETKVRQAALTGAEAIEAEKKGLLAVEEARETRLRETVARLRVRSPEDFVIALIDDAVQDEGKAVEVLANAQKLEAQIREKPEEAANLNQKLVGKKDEAVALMNKAKAQLLEAANLGQSVKARRTVLHDAEVRLKKERELLETLETELAPKK
jgi:hypothetical protein